MVQDTAIAYLQRSWTSPNPVFKVASLFNA